MEKYLENKRAIVASVVASGAVGVASYWLLSGRTVPSSGDADATGAGSSKKSAAAKRKKNRKRSARKGTPGPHGFPTVRDGPDTPAYPVIDDWSAVTSLGVAERKEIAEEFKAAGNDAFNRRNFDHALELYTWAIRAYDQEAVYFSNRAAIWGSWKNYEKVVKDTTEGLKSRPDYVKCYTRRAVAYENSGNYREAVLDYTSASISQNFQDDSLGESVDRVLRSEAEMRVASEGSATSKEFPSANFIRAYIQSFHERKLPESVVNASEGSAEYESKLAFDAMDKENQESYKQAYDSSQAVTLRIDAKQFTDREAEAMAWEYLATSQSSCNDAENALESMDRSSQSHATVPAYLKRSAIHVEAGNLTESEQDFTHARKLDPNSADSYYQLGQVDYSQGHWDSAMENYQRSIELDPSFSLAHIQLAVTEYRKDRIDDAKQRFEASIAEKPEESQIYNYYGEISSDMKDLDGASKNFDKAIELEKQRSGSVISVSPIVNKAMAIMQGSTSPEDVQRALEVCKQAVAIDPSSDVAVGSLAQFESQLGNTTEAIKWFEQNARLARTPNEQIQAYTFAEAARTQNRIAQERPIVRERLMYLAKNGQ